MGSRGTAWTALCAALLAACGQGASTSEHQLGIDASKISLTYVCENRFRVQNWSAAAVTVSWKVENSGDQGTVDLPAPPSNQAFSETFFSTRAIGTVVLSAGPTRIASVPNTQTPCTTQSFPLVEVAVTPTAASVAPGGTLQLSAQVTGDVDTAVRWSVEERNGGSVDATGVYAAPQTTGTFHVIATSHADPSRSATATVTVRPGAVQVVVRPAAVTLRVNGTRRLTAQVSGNPDTAVLWSVSERNSGGTVDPTGLYTAPAAVGTFHVVATSHADPTRSAIATVTVQRTPPPLLGQWDPVETWPVVPIHVVLMPDGRVLTWSRLGEATVWDPSSNTFTTVKAPSWEFCSGNAILPNGQVIVPGGHITDEYGLPDVNVFDPVTSTWSSAPPMAAGRWYPTAMTMADGSILVISGNTADHLLNQIPEVRNPDGTWRQLTGAQFAVPWYPNLFPAQGGRVFMAGSDRHSKFLDTTGIGQWIDGPTTRFANRDYGAAVMYDPGKVLIAGGAIPPTDTAEVINLNDASPAWRYTASMNHPRRHLTGTVLPDGKVLVTGGTSGPGFDNESQAVFSAELWDPATEKWTELSSMTILRVYHSIALLMPDARVLVGGGGEGAGGTDEPNIEMFSPPYLFNPEGSLAARPSITQAPDSLTYGASFQLSSPDAADISAVVLMRNGAVTHTFNSSTLRVPLRFSSSGSNSLQITTPALPDFAAPGPYMLFILNAQGVPSVAHMVHLG
jgi:Domain of unknown function (DUF1929)/Kelch motif/Bacterial Ig-like domain (group 2)